MASRLSQKGNADSDGGWSVPPSLDRARILLPACDDGPGLGRKRVACMLLGIGANLVCLCEMKEAGSRHALSPGFLHYQQPPSDMRNECWQTKCFEICRMPWQIMFRKDISLCEAPFAWYRHHRYPSLTTCPGNDPKGLDQKLCMYHG